MSRIALFLIALFALASCSREAGNGIADATAVGVGAAIAPVYKGYQIATGTNYTRRFPKVDVYCLKDETYVISNDGGWFTEGRARYGGAGGAHICLSAWVIDLNAEKPRADGKIVLTKQNLNNYFWDKRDPLLLEQIPSSGMDSKSKKYFYWKPGTPFIRLVADGRVAEFELQQD